jgi:hypothetical protein
MSPFAASVVRALGNLDAIFSLDKWPELAMPQEQAQCHRSNTRKLPSLEPERRRAFSRSLRAGRDQSSVAPFRPPTVMRHSANTSCISSREEVDHESAIADRVASYVVTAAANRERLTLTGYPEACPPSPVHCVVGAWRRDPSTAPTATSAFLAFDARILGQPDERVLKRSLPDEPEKGEFPIMTPPSFNAPHARTPLPVRTVGADGVSGR